MRREARISVRVFNDWRAWLEEEAARRDTTPSRIIRQALTEFRSRREGERQTAILAAAGQGAHSAPENSKA